MTRGRLPFMHVPFVTQELIMALEAVVTAVLATDDIARKGCWFEAVSSVVPRQFSPAGDHCVAIGCFAAVLALLVFVVRLVMLHEVGPVVMSGYFTAVKYAWNPVCEI